VLANGAEGEPLSGKDQVLLAYVPHLVLDGAAVAAAAVGAREATIAVGADAGNAFAAVQVAIAERERRRLDRVSFQLVTAPDRFVAGEETALVNWLNGGPAAPTFTPPRPFERGVRGAPTLVQNVETLAQLALLARFGPAWFRALGTREEPGSALVTLGGVVRQPGVYEIPLGLPLRELLARAGGPSAPIAAFLIGGYFGAWVEAEDARSLTLLDSDLRRVGASLGARAIFALPESACGIVETARVSRYLAQESAGQCGPCVRGLDAIATALEQLAWGKGCRRTLDARLDRWLAQVQGRGACRHPDGAGRLVESALRVFADERALHTRGSCSGAERPLLPVKTPRARRR
jgi:NADH:ubiquinone oxidoreductase subunit F (NADH-binding)